MTFKKAYTIAIEKSEDFREFDSLIKSKAANDQHTRLMAKAFSTMVSMALTCRMESTQHDAHSNFLTATW